MAVTAKQLFAMFNQADVKKLIADNYPKITPFTEAELQEFLDGGPGAEVPCRIFPVTRVHEFRQAMSAVGAYMVDKGLADLRTASIYKATWKVAHTVTCKYCNKPLKSKLMFPAWHCAKARCTLNAMRDSM